MLILSLLLWVLKLVASDCWWLIHSFWKSGGTYFTGRNIILIVSSPSLQDLLAVIFIHQPLSFFMAPKKNYSQICYIQYHFVCQVLFFIIIVTPIDSFSRFYISLSDNQETVAFGGLLCQAYAPPLIIPYRYFFVPHPVSSVLKTSAALRSLYFSMLHHYVTVINISLLGTIPSYLCPCKTVVAPYKAKCKQNKLTISIAVLPKPRKTKQQQIKKNADRTNLTQPCHLGSKFMAHDQPWQYHVAGLHTLIYVFLGPIWPIMTIMVTPCSPQGALGGIALFLCHCDDLSTTPGSRH